MPTPNFLGERIKYHYSHDLNKCTEAYIRRSVHTLRNEKALNFTNKTSGRLLSLLSIA